MIPPRSIVTGNVLGSGQSSPEARGGERLIVRFEHDGNSLEGLLVLPHDVGAGNAAGSFWHDLHHDLDHRSADARRALRLEVLGRRNPYDNQSPYLLAGTYLHELGGPAVLSAPFYEPPADLAVLMDDTDAFAERCGTIYRAELGLAASDDSSLHAYRNILAYCGEHKLSGMLEPTPALRDVVYARLTDQMRNTNRPAHNITWGKSAWCARRLESRFADAEHAATASVMSLWAPGQELWVRFEGTRETTSKGQTRKVPIFSPAVAFYSHDTSLHPDGLHPVPATMLIDDRNDSHSPSESFGGRITCITNLPICCPGRDYVDNPVFNSCLALYHGGKPLWAAVAIDSSTAARMGTLHDKLGVSRVDWRAPIIYAS